MLGFDPSYDDDNAASAYNLLLFLSALAVTAYTIARYAEYRNHLNYDNRGTRIFIGLLKIIAESLHTKKDDMTITGHAGQIIAIGPHRTGLVDGIVVASKMKGVAPHVFATDAYDSIPGARRALKMLNAITIKASASKNTGGRSANADALVHAGQVLQDKGCVALFPQGNFAKIGQEPYRVYDGAAKLALQNNAAIRVIRLDGFWSIDNPLIPLIIRNNSYYRALGTFFHMNNVRVTECCVIDFHLKPEANGLSLETKIERICSEMYAFYRHTGNLTAERIKAIRKKNADVSDKTHLLLWGNKLTRDQLTKKLAETDKERAELEQSAFTHQ